MHISTIWTKAFFAFGLIVSSKPEFESASLPLGSFNFNYLTSNCDTFTAFTAVTTWDLGEKDASLKFLLVFISLGFLPKQHTLNNTCVCMYNTLRPRCKKHELLGKGCYCGEKQQCEMHHTIKDKLY